MHACDFLYICKCVYSGCVCEVSVCMQVYYACVQAACMSIFCSVHMCEVMCAYAYLCVSGRGLTRPLTFWPPTRVLNVKGSKQLVFSPAIFPFSIFIKC